MKKILVFITALVIVNSIAFASTYAATCDQSFNGGMLRYNKTYKFYDVLNNNNNYNLYMNNFWVHYKQPGQSSWNTGSSSNWSYFDPGSDFDWTQQLKNASYTVAPRTSMRIFDSGPTNWRIKKHPNTRTNGTTSSYDFALRYKVSFDSSNNYPNTNDDIEHTECVYYSVTWCGDGVRDSAYEVCDPNDSSHAGWGTGGCNNQCEPINTPQPTTCDGITVTPSTGVAPVTSNVSCSATRASTYQIQCGNGQVFNSRTATCTYSTGGNYTAKCIVDGNITSNACKKTVKINNPTPSIRIDKVDKNSADIDGVQGNDTQTVLKGEKAVFKIRVTNIGAESLKNLKVNDAIAPNCAGNVSLPGTYPSTWSNFTTGGSGNHTNNVLEVNEWYEYTCEKGNTQSAYDNEATTEGIGVISNVKVTDFDDTEVLLVNPKIQVIKVDDNPADDDGTQGNDTQTVLKGENAIFKIVVENNGTEDLKNIILTDTLASACDSNGGFVNLSGKNFLNKNGDTVNISVSGAGNHNDNVFQIGEKFTYNCAKANTQNNYTNTIDVSGVGVKSNKTVVDDDPTEIVVKDIPQDKYDLALRKILYSTGTLSRGDTVVFEIEIFNQGNVDSGSFSLTDYIPTGLTLNDSNWLQTGTKATRTLGNIVKGGSKKVYITFTINSDAPLSISNYAEIHDDSGLDCDSSPDQNRDNDALVDDAIGSRCDTGTTDEDDHDIATITLEDDIYDLALRKTLSSTTPGPFNVGNTVTFNIEVFNQGTVDASNIEITDYIPTGLILNDLNWTQSGSLAIKLITGIISPGASVTETITFTIDSGISGNINNYAEISSDDGDDCDSIPDQDNTNDALTNDEIGSRCDINPDDEDDHDIETITVGTVVSACTNLSASPTSAKDSLTSALSCTGNNATSYLIEVKNSGGTVVYSQASATGNVTLTSEGTYTASCYVNGETTTPSVCQQTLRVTGGNSGQIACKNATQSGSTVTCEGTKQAKSSYVNCDGVKKGPKNITQVDGKYIAEFDCSASTYQCYVDDDTVPNSDIGDINSTWFKAQAWRTSNACHVTGGGPKCGNGIIESGEKCDFGSPYTSERWGKCYLPGNAKQCTYKSGGGEDPKCEDKPEGCVITTPEDGEVFFGPVGTVIVGHNQNPLDQAGTPYLYNNSNYDLAFDKICVKPFGDTAAMQGGENCQDITHGILYAYEREEILPTPDYKGNKNGIPPSKDYGEVELKTSIEVDGIDYYNSYLHSTLNVRVARPAVVTLGGGTSYIKDSNTTGDVETITSGVSGYSDNKNFAGTSVSDTGISSHVDSLDGNSNAGAVNEVALEKDEVDVTQSVLDTSTLTTNFSNHNGLDNVYSKLGSYNLDNAANVVGLDLSNLSQPTTFIIENGDLTISTDILANKNIAFVVKGGDIIITKDVEDLKGTYISIPVGGNGGKIRGNGATDKQLTVNGSLYGNIEDLVDDRYYVANSGGQLSVGTIVSFGSSLFSKPAPLVSQFIGEYLSAEKVAK